MRYELPERGGSGGAVTTIAVTGFPVDVAPRELRNLCRLCPGFQKAVPRLAPGRPMVLFVKFDTTDAASDIICQLQELIFDEEAAPEQRLRAEFARVEMRFAGAEEMHTQIAPQFAPQTSFPSKDSVARSMQLAIAASTWQHHQAVELAVAPAPSVAAGPPQKRLRSAAPALVDGVDTLACKVLQDQTGASIQEFFEQHEGYLVLKDNGRNCFVKFDSHVAAHSARAAAQLAGFVVDFARTSMILGEEGGSQTQWQEFATHAQQQDFTQDTSSWHGGYADPAPVAIVPAAPPPWTATRLALQGDTAGASVPRDPDTGMPIDTVACKAAGFTEMDFEGYFGSIPGFSKIKHNVKNCFVKFESPEFAQQAIAMAREAGFTAEFARFCL